MQFSVRGVHEVSAVSSAVPPHTLDVLCFSHLRWHFVTQRPQHLLRRAAQQHRVFFWEEPVWEPDEHIHGSGDTGHEMGWLEIAREGPLLWIVRPHVRAGGDAQSVQRELLADLLNRFSITQYISWYYTPMALGFSRGLSPLAVVYDCMDELRNFAGAPPELARFEKDLFALADVVFTGGLSLYEAKRQYHRNVHPYPSSIDVAHFATARDGSIQEPPDQAHLGHPRAGFYGVLDERLDVLLLSELAVRLPQVQFVLLGPVVKVDPALLPRAANLHYLGGKRYEDLPAYLSGWDVALLPFAMNEATEFISPTKTPEYLAAGVPVVSTPIRDVVRTYGDTGLAAIGSNPQEFATAIERALSPHSPEWRSAVDHHLAKNSWDLTWKGMWQEVERAMGASATGAFAPADALESTGPEQIASRFRALRTETVMAVPFAHPRLPPRSRILHAERFDVIVAGAGFAGSVLAERLASQLGQRVLVVDRREHIGGNAYDERNAEGILIHPYGPHIFHTNSAEVVRYLSQFTAWRPYEHRVLASVREKLLPIPINLDTINRLYGLTLDSAGMRSKLEEAAAREAPNVIRTSEDIVVSRVGRELYELFFRNYTRKQWGVEPSALDSSVAGRIPVRFDRDDRYFSDSFQAMPKAGYTAMFERMLDHPRITVRTGVDFRDVSRSHQSARVVYTGPIDEYFNHRYGPLAYRSLAFQHETHDREVYQPVAVVNFPNDYDYTRITEFKYLTGQVHPKTSIVREFPRATGDPYYPVPNPENTALYERYRELTLREPRTVFCGRLASYRYFNMDQVVAQALVAYRRLADEQAVALSRAERAAQYIPLESVAGD